MLFAPTDRLAFLEVRGTGPDSRETSCVPFEVGLILTDYEGVPLSKDSSFQGLVCFDSLNKSISSGEWPKKAAGFVEQWDLSAATLYAEGKSARHVARALEAIAMIGALSVDEEDYPVLVCRDSVYSSNLLAKIFKVADMDMPFRPRAIDSWVIERVTSEDVETSPVSHPRALDVAESLRTVVRSFLV